MPYGAKSRRKVAILDQNGSTRILVGSLRETFCLSASRARNSPFGCTPSGDGWPICRRRWIAQPELHAEAPRRDSLALHRPLVSVNDEAASASPGFQPKAFDRLNQPPYAPSVAIYQLHWCR